MRNRIELPYAPPPRGFMLDPSHPLARGLVGWWPLNGDTADYSGKRNHGARTAPSTRRGGVWNGTNFDGATSLVTISRNTVLEPTDAITVSIVARLVSFSEQFSVLMSKEKASWSDPYYSWTLRFATTSTLFAAVPVGEYTDGDFIIGTLSSTAVGRWLRATLVYDGSIQLYENGTQIGTVNNPGGITYYNTPTVIGGFYGLSTGNFNGAAADARIYNRALSAAEVKMLYERPFDMCVDAWPFRSYSIPSGSGRIYSILTPSVISTCKSPVLQRA